MLLHGLHGLLSDVPDEGLIIGGFVQDGVDELLVEFRAQLIPFRGLLIELGAKDKSVLADIAPKT